MNDQLTRTLQSVTNYINALTTQKKTALALACLLTVGLIAGGVAAMKHDPYEVLFQDLLADESKNVEKKLSEANIPYKVSDDRSTVRVPASQAVAGRMAVAKDGSLPGSDVVGFEKFDASTIGMSTYVQRIQYVRAVQGELIRSIERLTAVKHARVHISIPPKKTFLEEEDPPKASVILELKSGQIPSKQEIRGIAHLVSSAVEGLKTQQVTIVDTAGNLLHRPEDEATPAISTALLEMERSIEAEYEKRIEDMLMPVVGMGKVRAKVTAEMDPSRSNTTEETYDPDKATIRSTVRNDEVNQGSRPNPIGIPGSRSNLPGAEAANAQIPVATNSTEKNMQNTNYAIPRKVQITDRPSGSIKRLTVAVVVDGIYNNKIYSPRTEEELKRLRDLVANSVGIDDSRRDNVTISSMPFSVSEMAPVVDTTFRGPWYLSPEIQNPLIRYGMMGLFGLLFALLVIRPMFRFALKPQLAGSPEFNSLPRTIAEIEAAKKEDSLLALASAGSGSASGGLAQVLGAPPGMLEEVEPLEKKEEEELKKRIMERLGNTPKKGFRIVQDWLEEEGGAPATAEG